VNGLKKIVSKDAWTLGKRLYAFLKNEKVDVVVAYHHDAEIWGGIVSFLAGVPVISSRRDMGYQMEGKHIWFYRLFNRFFSRFITVSEAVKNEIVKREWIRPERVVTIHNGLQPEIFDRLKKNRQLVDELGINQDKIVIGMVASFRPIKGQQYLVEAVAILVKEFPNIQVVIVGYNDTEYFNKVYGRIEELSLKEYFIFTGIREDIPDLLMLFDIFVLSSVNEGFSNAIIEAMAASKPVIAPDSGGNPEAVLHGETGYLFRPCDSLSLAERIRELLRSQTRRDSMGRKGRLAVEDKFRIEQMINKNEQIFLEVSGNE
jgi:glycosyltransferase involved in cell wall biosynthesis